MISHITLVLFLLVACITCATKPSSHCKRLATKDHLKDLSALIDTQLKSACQISFNYVKESDLNNRVCFLKAAYYPLGDILSKEMKFKENTTNFNTQRRLLDSHENLEKDCFKNTANESQSSARCIKKFSLPVEEMLGLVHRYFSLAEELIHNGEDFSQDCDSIFQKCSGSENENAASSGVVTDQDCECSATSPATWGLVTSFLPTFESLPSITDQLDSRETAASTLQLFILPDTMQPEGQSVASTRPRVPRSTYEGPSMDFRAAAHAAASSAPEEELMLAATLQGQEPVVMDTAAFQDPTLSPQHWSPRLNDIHPFLSNQQQTESMGTGSTFPGSGASSSNEIGPYGFPSQHPSLSGLVKPSFSNQWFQARDVDKAIPRLAPDSDRTDSSGPSSPSLEPSAALEPLDNSGAPSSGSRATLPPSNPALFPILGSEGPFPTARQPFRTSLGLVSSDSYSWGEQTSRNDAPGVQQSTQLRERRAGRGEEGLAKDREAEDSLSGPNFDLGFIPLNTDKHTKKAELRDSPRIALTYVLVPSVLGILLAVGGLLFYLHKSRLARRRQQRMGSNIEEQEGSPLNRSEEHFELEMQGEV